MVLIDSGMVLDLVHCSWGEDKKRGKNKKQTSRLTCASKEARIIGQPENNKYQLTKKKEEIIPYATSSSGSTYTSTRT